VILSCLWTQGGGEESETRSKRPEKGIEKKCEGELFLPIRYTGITRRTGGSRTELKLGKKVWAISTGKGNESKGGGTSRLAKGANNSRNPTGDTTPTRKTGCSSK